MKRPGLGLKVRAARLLRRLATYLDGGPSLVELRGSSRRFRVEHLSYSLDMAMVERFPRKASEDMIRDRLGLKAAEKARVGEMRADWSGGTDRLLMGKLLVLVEVEQP